MPAAPCAIWKSPAELIEKAGDFEVFDSPRAGGKYWISGSAIGLMPTLTDLARRLLTTWLCEQRRSGAEVPRIQSDVVDLVRSRRSLTVPTRLTRALILVGSEIKELGSQLEFNEAHPDTPRYLAETESKGIGELNQLFQMLEKSGLVEGTFYLGGGGHVCPTPSGWQELEKLELARTDSSQAFVAMWFSEDTSDAYLNGVLPALRATGYKAVRIDKKEHNNKIDDEIIAEIRRSRFVIADLHANVEASAAEYITRPAMLRAWASLLFGRAKKRP
jgi:hypothetical protein